MDVFEVIQNRRTVRAFEQRDVPRPVIEKVLRAAIWAPNPLNAQTWRFDVVAGAQRDEIVKIIGQFPAYMADVLRSYPEDTRRGVLEFSRDLGGAPVIVVASVPALVDNHVHKIDVISVGAAIQNLQLAAWAEGLGCVCLTNALWVEADIARYLKLTRREIVTVIPMGYPSAIPEAPARRDDVVNWIGLEADRRAEGHGLEPALADATAAARLGLESR